PPCARPSFPTRRSSDLTIAAFATSFPMLLVARVFTGLGVGAMTAAIGSLVFEFASKRRRELSLGFVTGAFPFGTIVGGIVATWLDRKSTRLNSSHVKIS